MRMKWLVRDRAFYQTAAVLAAPVVLQNMITIMVNMLDTMMLGRYGEIQLSGSSLANSFVGIHQILCMGIGGGAAVLTAQYWGAENREAVRKTTVLMVRISMVFSLIFFKTNYIFNRVAKNNSYFMRKTNLILHAVNNFVDYTLYTAIT